MIKKNINIRFEMLCQLPFRMHVYWTDANHVILGANDQQMRVTEKLYDIKTGEAIHGLSLLDIYQRDKNKAEQLCLENETVLGSNDVLHTTNTFMIPEFLLADLITTKLPCYDEQGRARGVLGISYYIREIDLSQAAAFKLTARELDCLDYLLQGKSAKATGSALGISPRTVEDYLDNVKHKLNCQNKIELQLKLRKLNLIKRYRPMMP